MLNARMMAFSACHDSLFSIYVRESRLSENFSRVCKAPEGVTYGTSPIMAFDHEDDDWTVPLNLTVSKTVVVGGRPWKLGAEVNYYVEQPDAFGPEWMVSFSIAPVVENVMADWFK